MDKRFISTAIIVAVIISSMAAVIVYDSNLNQEGDSGTDYNVIARVNSEGSGLYVSTDYLTRNSLAIDDFYTKHTAADGHVEYVVTTANKAAWGGSIVGTPGTGTIQFVQLKEIAGKAGLDFKLYQSGTTVKEDTMYYIEGMANSSKILNSDISLDIGIIWEPQYSNVINDPKYVELGLTNNFFPGHTCCVIFGNSEYMNAHPDVTIKFLAGYLKGVEYVQSALSGDADKYDHLVEICTQKTAGISDNVIKAALDNITFLGFDEDSNDLNLLRKDFGDLIVSLPNLYHTYSDLGFSSSAQFGDRFVDDSYIRSAIDESKGSVVPLDNPSTIKVACIAGDIHQIALHVAIDQNYFSAYNINVITCSESGGPGVATAVQNSTAQFGFAGAPPVTLMVVNGEYVKA